MVFDASRLLTNQKNAFTLLEIILSVAILAFIAVIVLNGLASFREAAALNQAVDSSLGFLRDAREKTLASENGSNYGVHFASSTVTFFMGGVYNSGASSNIVFSLSSITTVSAITLSTTTANVVFDRLTGEAESTGTVTFQSTRSGTTKRITIYSAGTAVNQ